MENNEVQTNNNESSLLYKILENKNDDFFLFACTSLFSILLKILFFKIIYFLLD